MSQKEDKEVVKTLSLLNSWNETTMYKMKNILNEINGRRDIEEEKVSKVVNIVIKLPKMKHREKSKL